MLDRAILRSEAQAVRDAARAKGVDAPLDEFLRLDEAFRALRSELDRERAELNRSSKAIGELFAQGKKQEGEAARALAKALSESVKAREEDERRLEQALRDVELQIPNLPHASVPLGTGPEQNAIVRSWGKSPNFDFEPRPHWELGAQLGILDFERAAKISGSGFALYRGWGARLQRALATFMLDHQTLENAYEEAYPPVMVTRDSLVATGQLPKFEEELYRADEDLFLIPTAEVPLTNMFREEILEAWQLPIRIAAFSGCFRKEAGAAGKDTRGIQRMHQFDKVELVKITLPETSYDELETLTLDAESVLQALELPYRVSLQCTAEMGFSNSKQYDLEVWAPGIGAFLEVSSCSNFEAFQARRANIRFRRGQGEKPEFAHTLNGSGLACPRLFIAILENFQNGDGSVTVPERLRPYVGADRIVSSS
jgi:seryl-tRNA synthetase